VLQVVALILPAWRRHILEKVIVEETKLEKLDVPFGKLT
jgi:hypothetical protein